MADTTFGRIQNALMSATNELTVAAANINFEFTMVKYEAPPEYQPLSQTLSSLRRNEAEGGEIHITARRLGALFEGVCPRTPNLINAYGARASEIASQATATRAPNPSNWIFSAYVGVDTTSLWAAATSRKAALPVHLLACMLARIWDAAEAISLWVEIVAERRADIAARFESGDEMPFMQTAAAVQPEITREQLAKWDASARAWLRTADVIQTHQHKQFLLIIKNISLPINSEANTYRSVMLAWVSALETMEGLLSGGPHVVRDGAVLLALSAWHLYPDMVAYGGKKSIEVFMKDPLVHSGGVLSLGISDSDVRQSKGVYWSLSLAHHKFYGRPVVKTVQVTPDGSRMTFLELQQAVIGVILAQWNIPVSQTNDALKFLLQISASINYDSTSWVDRWVEMITVPIIEYFKDEEHGALLLALGRRRRDFIKAPAQGDKLEFPYFGLLQMAKLISLVSTTDARIELLRRLARRVKDIDQTATLFALKDEDGWIYATESTSSSRHKGVTPVMTGPVTRRRNKMAKSARQSSRRWVPMRTAMSNASTLQEVIQFDEGEFEHCGRTLIRDIRTGRMFEFVFGDAEVAAFFREQDLDVFSSIIPPTIERDDVRWCIQHDLISSQDLRAVMSQRSPIMSALRILALASGLYSDLAQEGATISTTILTYPLAPDLVNRLTSKSNMGIIYQKGGGEYRLRLEAALIAYLETGRYMVSPDDLSEATLGLSVGDSIYVPSNVLQDPSTLTSTPLSASFTRLLGNLGRPGLTILTSPATPDCRDNDLSSWKKSVVPFDGTAEDQFSRTSLHLSLTEWNSPLQTSQSVGQRDSQGQHIEAVVSVRDQGRWVADVCPVSALRHAMVHVLPPQSACHHQTPQRPGPDIQALETWDQILDCPEGILVTKSHNNWVARMALVCVLAQHCQFSLRRIVICPPSVCWQCIDTSVRNTIFIY